MLAVGWVVAAVLVAAWLTSWASFSITRLDRLHARVDAAEATLDAELVRRGVALEHLVRAAPGPLAPASSGRPQRPALGRPERQATENDVGRAVVAELARVEAGPLPPGAPATAAVAELREACERVHLARLFYDDAVRDTRILRDRRLTRVLRLAGHRELPPYFDIDDTVPPVRVPLRAQVPQP